jgi:hypothetical protein
LAGKQIVQHNPAGKDAIAVSIGITWPQLGGLTSL